MFQDEIQDVQDPVKIQQVYYERLGDRDWECYTLNQLYLLKRKVGFALYGPPQAIPEQEDKTGYTEDQDNQVDCIYKLIIDNRKY